MASSLVFPTTGRPLSPRKSSIVLGNYRNGWEYPEYHVSSCSSCWYWVRGGTYEQERIVLLERLGVGDGDVSILWRSMHLVEDLLWKGLLDLEDIAGTASLLDASSFSLCELLDVAPCGVLNGQNVSIGSRYTCID